MFKNKKVLLVGLGLLGGGVAVAKFLLKQGALLTVTDKRDKLTLYRSIKKLPKGVSYRLGSHKKSDFKRADIVVVNPAVPLDSEWLIYAKKLGKKIYNDLTLFLTFFRQKNKDFIAITGTRGKTTTSLWINQLLTNSVLGGNIPEKGLLKILNKKGNPFVLETSSFQLEYMTRGLASPKIAVITNLYQDHLNRHKTMKMYMRAKANIFLNQTKEDCLILNYDDAYTKDFLKLKPKSKLFFFSLKKLPKNKNGVFASRGRIYHQINKKVTFIVNCPFESEFQNQNLLGALLASFLYTKNWKNIVSKINSLPEAPMRREVILKKKNLTVVNDSAGTSPDATVALLELYKKISKKEKILITGGTDKELDFKVWAKRVKSSVRSENLFLLGGSATDKMIPELNHLNFWIKGESPKAFSDLKEILKEISAKKTKKTILFSPSSASFEKFKNEFDRGKKFNSLVKTYF